MHYQFGIEHEVAFVNAEGQFADFSNTTFQQFEQIVAALPEYSSDYPQLRLGDAGIKRKRWYIEGYERFSETGELMGCTPKGIEIRTTIQSSIQGAVAELTESFEQLRAIAAIQGPQKRPFTPALISFNPHYPDFTPQPPLNHYETRRRNSSAEKRTAHIPMLTHGPDLNLSIPGQSTEDLIRVGKKLTYYSPAIVPFSFSSPFYKGQLWPGLSARTYHRTGVRPAVMVFVEHPKDLIDSAPSLTKIARIPAEVGRIEFKACDSCGDFQLYAGLLALLKGLALDQTLPGQALVPSQAEHQHSARYGFQDPALQAQAIELLQAAEASLSDPEEQQLLQPLWQLVHQQRSPADAMIEQYQAGASLEEILQRGYSGELRIPTGIPLVKENSRPSVTVA